MMTEAFKKIADLIKNEKIDNLEEAKKRADELLSGHVKEERFRTGMLMGLVVRSNGEINWRLDT